MAANVTSTASAETDRIAPIKWLMALIFVVVWGRRWMGREWVFAWAG